MRLANRITEGLALVALGLIFLGCTLGYLPWSVTTTFLALISLWPVLLVTVGLDIVGRQIRADWPRLASSLIVLTAILYGGLVLPATGTSLAWFSISGVPEGETSPYSFSASRNGVTRATLDVKGAIGEVKVRAASGPTLVRMSGRTPFDNPALDVSRGSGRADVMATIGADNIVTPLVGRASMDLALSPLVTWDVRFEAGASTLDADLTRVPLSGFLLKTGASDSRVTVGDVPAGEGEVELRVESGAAAVTLSIPEDAEARIEAQIGVASISVPRDCERVGSSGRNYESAGYASASRRYLIHVQTGVGTVSIKRH